MKREHTVIHTTIAPWLTVQKASKAVDFYKAAFTAIETYRLETPEGLVVKLSVNGAEFWLSGGHMGAERSDIQSLACENIRMILTVTNPDILFANALAAGASEISPITEEHGWRLGRLVDPFGLHWEIGHPVSK
jgi:PhnB protein